MQYTIAFPTFFLFLLFCSCQQNEAPPEYDLKITPLESTTAASFRGIASLGAQTVWVAGTNGTVLKSVDGGTSWTSMRLPDADSLDFRDIAILTKEETLIMSAGSEMKSRIYKTEDSGKTWRTVLINTKEKAFFNGLDFWNTESGFLVSDPIDEQLYVLKSDNAGESWTRVGAATLPKLEAIEYGFAASGTGIVARSNGQLWIATGGDKARVFRSIDVGKSWAVRSTPMANGNNSSGIFSLSFRDSLNGIAVGGDYQNPDAKVATIIRTMDGGKNWEAIPNDLGHKACVQHLGDTYYLAAGRTGLIWSKDDGNTWIELTEEAYYTIAFDLDSRTGYLAGPEGRVAKIELVLH